MSIFFKLMSPGGVSVRAAGEDHGLVLATLPDGVVVEVDGSAAPNGWMRLADGRGFVARELPGGAQWCNVTSFHCDHCALSADGQERRPITGLRYKCNTCPDFDLCEICLLTNEQRGGVHDPSHRFIRYPPAGPAAASAPPVAVTTTAIDTTAISSSTATVPVQPSAAVVRGATFGDAMLVRLRALAQGTSTGPAGNLFFSPLSIEFCLLLCANGCRGQTLHEVLTALHLVHRGGDLAAINAEAAATMQAFSALQTVVVANSVWTKTVALDRDFAATVLQSYQAAARSTRSFEEVNSWVSDRTNGKIQNLLAAMPDAVLVNCVYFKDDWRLPFEPCFTQPHTFAPAPGHSTTVQMMRQQDSFRHVATKSYQAISLNYRTPMCAILVLPAADQPLSSLPPVGDIYRRLSTAQPALGVVQIPKFRCEVTYDALERELQALGVRAAFDQAHQARTRELDPMLRDKGQGDYLYFASCVHKVFVKVDEKGTEAAAATAMMVRAGCRRPPEPVFHFLADRPFMMAICTCPSPREGALAGGRVLFQGEISDPVE